MSAEQKDPRTPLWVRRVPPTFKVRFRLGRCWYAGRKRLPMPILGESIHGLKGVDIYERFPPYIPTAFLTGNFFVLNGRARPLWAQKSQVDAAQPKDRRGPVYSCRQQQPVLCSTRPCKNSFLSDHERPLLIFSYCLFAGMMFGFLVGCCLASFFLPFFLVVFLDFRLLSRRFVVVAVFLFFFCFSLVHTFDIYATCFGVAIRQWPCDGTLRFLQSLIDYLQNNLQQHVSMRIFCVLLFFIFSYSSFLSLSFCADINVNHQCFALLLIRWTVVMTDRNGFTYTRNIISEPANS